MKVHHLGLACNDIEKEKLNIAKFHNVISVSETIFDPEQNASLCYIRLAEGISLELISGKQVENLVKNKIFYYHICYETSEFDKQIKKYVAQGAILMSAPKPALLFNNRRVAFLYLPYGIIELLEEAAH